MPMVLHQQRCGRVGSRQDFYFIRALFYIIWERYKYTNPYDMVLEYDGKPWLSSDDFLRTGIEAYKKDHDSTVKAKILKGTMDNIVETEFWICDDLIAKAADSETENLAYGIHIESGYLITRKLREVAENKMLTPGTFFRPVLIDEDSECEQCTKIKDLKLDVIDLYLFIEDTYEKENKIFFKLIDPVYLYVSKKAEYYGSLEYEFISSYFLNNDIKPVSMVEAYDIIQKSDMIEYAEIFCDLYRWLYFRDTLFDDILFIQRVIE